jgi:uncharacterized protein (TIGR03083 family)
VRLAPAVDTAPLFPGLHRELIGLLRALAPADWERPTIAGAWQVRDVAAHLLDGQLRKLSFHRDGLLPPAPPAGGYGDLVGFLNGLNRDWVTVARRLSPRVLVDLLETAGTQLAEFVGTLDPRGRALFGVAWAGEAASENWLDTGREYTELWHHQQQIRLAVGAPLLEGAVWLRTVLEVSVRALVRAYADVASAPGATVTYEVEGPAGGAWTVVREDAGWRLYEGAPDRPTARVRVPEDLAWRIFFKVPGASGSDPRVRRDGDAGLAAPAVGVLAVMA